MSTSTNPPSQPHKIHRRHARRQREMLQVAISVLQHHASQLLMNYSHLKDAREVAHLLDLAATSAGAADAILRHTISDEDLFQPARGCWLPWRD